MISAWSSPSFPGFRSRWCLQRVVGQAGELRGLRLLGGLHVGGHLAWKAVRSSRERLSHVVSGQSIAAMPRVKRFREADVYDDIWYVMWARTSEKEYYVYIYIYTEVRVKMCQTGQNVPMDPQIWLSLGKNVNNSCTNGLQLLGYDSIHLWGQ